jgi:hypothetical protein
MPCLGIIARSSAGDLKTKLTGASVEVGAYEVDHEFFNYIIKITLLNTYYFNFFIYKNNTNYLIIH